MGKLEIKSVGNPSGGIDLSIGKELQLFTEYVIRALGVPRIFMEGRVKIKADEKGQFYQLSRFGPGYNLDFPIPDWEPLSINDLNLLEDGTQLIVLWWNGQGPYECILRKRGTKTYALSEEEDREGSYPYSACFEGPIRACIGTEIIQTKVWKVGTNDERADEGTISKSR